jgi:D-psicose/D-tagatose/L-ribulose 3-epimerase
MTDPRIRLGAHTFIWAPRWDDCGARAAASQAAAAGLSIVEIPLLEPSRIDVDATIQILADHRLQPTCSLGLPTEAHAPDHPDEAIQFLREAIDTCAAIGSEWLTGALYGHLGLLSGAAPTAAEHETISGVLSEAADHAKERGVRLGIEVINRYETHLVNTAEQALDLLERIDRTGTVFAHLDTFHMNIEEPDIGGAVRLLGDQLGYVHLAESDRGVIGHGTFPFRELFEALEDIHFSGPAVIEAFINAPADLRTATASWRPVAGDAASFLDASLSNIAEHLA